MDESLEKALLDMEAQDQAVRTELTAAGALNDNYHQRLEEVHRANSSRLRQIIAVFGWPGFTLVGDEYNIELNVQTPAILLMHMFQGNRHDWDAQIPALTSQGYRVLNVDLRGHGE